MPTGRRVQRLRSAGFVYLGLLWTVAITTAALALFGESWTRAAQRERERELVFRGEQIKSAIERYRRADPAAAAWPTRFEDLLEDRRGDEPRHHLRRSFDDPLGAGWAEIRDASGALIGVHTRSDALALGRWPRDASPGVSPSRLRDWRFVAADALDLAPERLASQEPRQ